MKVAVDPLECGCSGYCMKLAPNIFGWRADRSAAQVHSDPVTEDDRRLAREAAELCPARAITVSDDNSGQVHDAR
jgi:ferredoxin